MTTSTKFCQQLADFALEARELGRPHEKTAWLQNVHTMLRQPPEGFPEEIVELMEFAASRIQVADPANLDSLVLESQLAIEALGDWASKELGCDMQPNTGPIYAARRILATLRMETVRSVPETKAELRPHLRRLGTVMALLRGNRGYRFFLDSASHAAMLTLQARLLDWLRGYEEASETEGFRLLSDCRAAIRLLPEPPRHPKVVEEDAERFARLRRRLEQHRDLTKSTLRSYDELWGSNEGLDILFEREEISAEEWSVALERVDPDAPSK